MDFEYYFFVQKFESTKHEISILSTFNSFEQKKYIYIYIYINVCPTVNISHTVSNKLYVNEKVIMTRTTPANP